MENSSSQQREYETYLEMARKRLEKGLPPLGPKNSLLTLPSGESRAYVTHSEDEPTLEVSSVGDVRLKSESPERPYYVLFKR